ncbi:MAG: peptide chain release factor-like protein [Planctomycetota bacterium]
MPDPPTPPQVPASGAELPDPQQRMHCRTIESPHPSSLPIEALLDQCELRTQRRSGPGGQHRNKTSSGAFLTHRPTELVAEATERRSQAENRDVALQRLRFLLAIEVRTQSPLEGATLHPLEREVRERFSGHPLKFHDANESKPTVLAMVLNDLWIAGGQPSLLVASWRVSTSKVVALLRSHPAALTWVNRVRTHHQRKPLH